MNKALPARKMHSLIGPIVSSVKGVVITGAVITLEPGVRAF